MKHKAFLSLLWVGCLLLSCNKENEPTVTLNVKMPTSFDATTDIDLAISVWADGLENARFTLTANQDRNLTFKGKAQQLSGTIVVLYPYDATATLADNQLSVIRPNMVPRVSSFVGTTTLDEPALSADLKDLGMVSSRVKVQFSNLPANALSATLRILPKEGYAGNLFHSEAQINLKTYASTYHDLRQYDAVGNVLMGTDYALFCLAPENYNNTTFQLELLLRDSESELDHIAVYTFDGKNCARAQTVAYELDCNQAHETYPAYTDGLLSLGLPIKVGNLTFAPVNDGYNAVYFPFGQLYKQNSAVGLGYQENNPLTEFCNDATRAGNATYLYGWRKPTAAEMEQLLAQERSLGYTKGLTYGWWFGGLYLEAAGSIDEQGLATGRAQEAYYWTSDLDRALYISDTEAKMVETSTRACAVRCVLK